jgi:hypothetical protein
MGHKVCSDMCLLLATCYNCSISYRWQGDLTTHDESLAARLSLWLEFLTLQAAESTPQITNSKNLSALQYSYLLAERKWK